MLTFGTKRGLEMDRPRKSTGRRVIAVLSAAGLLGGLAAMLGGCPIYAADSCDKDPSCTGTVPVDTSTADAGACGYCAPGYICENLTTGYPTCVPYDCRAPERACTGGATCTAGTGGVYSCKSATDAGHDTADADAGTDSGPLDCRKTGCISGYKCSADSTGAFACASTNPNACVADGDCIGKMGNGALCLGGVCTAAKDLCSDSTQCKSGKECVDGRCVDTCSTGDGGGSSCDTGYSCVSGACIGGTSACGGSSGGDAGADGSSDAGASCSASNACVATRCVAKCALDASCPAGQVCVGGGCVQDDRPIFFCDASGTADGTQDVCAAGSICLHHNCYLACTGTGDTTSCSEPAYPVCKSVTTSSGQHYVCGSSTNLGSECDPTATPPITCATGKFCIDGFCK